jgi:hypothetical protein
MRGNAWRRVHCSGEGLVRCIEGHGIFWNIHESWAEWPVPEPSRGRVRACAVNVGAATRVHRALLVCGKGCHL